MKRNEKSLAAIQHFVSDSSYVHCTVLDTCTRTYVHVFASRQRALHVRCTQHVATPTVILNFREEIFVIISQITKFTKILYHENLELYST